MIEFIAANGLYRSGERAGFPPELAAEYVRRGLAKLVAERVPAVDPRTAQHDFERRAAELKMLSEQAQSQADFHRNRADAGEAP